MLITTHHYADTIVAAPAGRIDHRSAAELETALAPLLAQAGERKGSLVLDFAAVEYISSVGLRALMIAGKRMHARGAALAIATLQPVVAEIFAISHFNGLFRVYPSVREALAAMSPAALAALDRG